MGKIIENDRFSKLLKFLLATNYYYQIIDEIKETEFYRQRLKFLINQVESELDHIHKNPKIKEFYKIADDKLYNNNLDLHTYFFEKLTSLSSSMVEQFMIEFLEKHGL